MAGEEIFGALKPFKMRMTSGSWRTDLLASLLLFSLGIWVVLEPFSAGGRIPGDLGDGALNLSLLEFFYRALLATVHGGAPDFLNAPFFYPWPRVTNFSDTHWGDAEVYALLRGFGMSLLAAFRAWILIGFACTYISAFVSFRMLRLQSWGAAVGAFLFTFCLPMTAQIGHAQLVYRLWVPPAVVALDRFLTYCSLRAGAACLLFVALELAISVYLGVFLSLLLVSYAVALSLFARERLPGSWLLALRRGDPAELVIASTLIAIALVVLVVVAVPYHRVQSLYGFARPWDEVKTLLPRLGSYLLAGDSGLWPNLSSTFQYPPWPNEHQIFPGLSAIIPLAWFMLSGCARKRRPLSVSMVAAAWGLFAVTLDLAGYSLYWFIYQIPGLSAIRGVTRIILVMMLPLSALLGMMIDDLLLNRPTRSRKQLLAVALVVLTIVECSVISPYSSKPSVWRARMEALDARLPKNLPAGAVLAIASDPGWPGLLLTQTDAELAAVRFGVATLNGYSGSNPPSWRPMTTCRDVEDNLRAGRKFLKEHGLPGGHLPPSRLILVGISDCENDAFARDQ